MPIKTTVAMSGFIAATPQLTYSEQGRARMYARVGQEHWTRNEDRSFTQEQSTFHDLVMFDRAAEIAAERFKKGDRFIAEGSVRDYERPNPDGTIQRGQQFAARRIGHDTATTNYQIDRTPRHTRAQQAAAPGREQAQQAADAAPAAPAPAPAREPHTSKIMVLPPPAPTAQPAPIGM
ncbi:MAG: single-stranded DNA-binding protein [Bifidobacteriaceae bacterium]|jgi:single-stranded DNA-binding protein|nr:single-stranded DNA-binding protein [Bifidobacteriaceae bacterium]